MNRSPLEKASWIAGIVSAVAALWIIFFPAGQTKQDSSTRQQMTAADPPKPEIPSTATTFISGHTDQATSSNRSCPSTTVITALRSQARFLSTKEARDAAYRPLIKDAICLNDLELATEIAGLVSTYGGRDELYQQILDAAITTGKRDTAERVAGFLSTSSLRDAARHKIIASLRGQPQKVEK
jgi:hypothetical protein